MACLVGTIVGAILASPVAGYRQGPLADRVGVCDIGPTCRDVGCHISFPLDVTELPWTLETDTGPLPAAGWVPGRTYRMLMTIDERPNPFAAIWGFELAPLLCPSGVGAGEMTALDTDRTRLFSEQGITYLSHSCTCAVEVPWCCGYLPELEPSLIQWSFLWRAPARGTQEVTFAMAFNAANWDGTADNDRITLARTRFSQDATCAPPIADLRVRKTACDPAFPGQDRLELQWARGGSPAIIRETENVATAPRDRAQWTASPSDCLVIDARPLVFYSVAEDCLSGAEGEH